MKTIIFEGKVKPSTDYVGTAFQKRKRRDRFGILESGESRSIFIMDKYNNYIYLPKKYGNKNIRITIEVTNGKNRDRQRASSTVA